MQPVLHAENAERKESEHQNHAARSARKRREQQEGPLSSVELSALIWAKENRRTFRGQLLLWRFSQWILFSADLAGGRTNPQNQKKGGLDPPNPEVAHFVAESPLLV
jgi:hypothetical protein